MGIQTFPRALWLDADGKQLVLWPVEEIKTLRRERFALVSAEIGSGGLREIAGVDALQANVEVVFEVPSLEDAEELDPKWLRDPQKLCAEKDASSPGPGGVGPFGLVVMASGNMQEQTTVLFRVFRYGGTYKVLMCADLTRYILHATLITEPNAPVCLPLQILNKQT
jgi:beta-fructofuranosidase